jgi:hypothetical protein
VPQDPVPRARAAKRGADAQRQEEARPRGAGRGLFQDRQGLLQQPLPVHQQHRKQVDRQVHPQRALVVGGEDRERVLRAVLSGMEEAAGDGAVARGVGRALQRGEGGERGAGGAAKGELLQRSGRQDRQACWG